MAIQHPSYIHTYIHTYIHIYIYIYIRIYPMHSNTIWQLCHKEWRCSRIIGNHQFHGRNSLGFDKFMPFRRTIQLDGFPMISSPRFNCTVVPPIHRFIYHSLTIFNWYLQVYTPHGWMRTEGAPHALRAGALPASAMARVARVVRCGGFWMVVFDAKKISGKLAAGCLLW